MPGLQRSGEYPCGAIRVTNLSKVIRAVRFNSPAYFDLRL